MLKIKFTTSDVTNNSLGTIIFNPKEILGI